MNKRRFTAILTLVLFLFGLVGFYVGLTTKNNALGNSSVFILFACAISTFILRKQVDAERKAEEEARKKESEFEKEQNKNIANNKTDESE